MAALRQREWTMSIDLKDAYFHIPVVKRSRKYLHFVIGDKVFQFRALPFGLSTAPLVFTRVIQHDSHLCTYLQDKGAHVLRRLATRGSRQIGADASHALASRSV